MTGRDTTSRDVRLSVVGELLFRKLRSGADGADFSLIALISEGRLCFLSGADCSERAPSEDKRPGLRQCAGMGRVYVKVRHGILPSAAGDRGWGRVSRSERARFLGSLFSPCL